MRDKTFKEKNKTASISHLMFSLRFLLSFFSLTGKHRRSCTALSSKFHGDKQFECRARSFVRFHCRRHPLPNNLDPSNVISSKQKKSTTVNIRNQSENGDQL